MTHVYLLHFNQPLSQGADPRTGKPRSARHYIGSTENVEKRLHEHAIGHGARIVAALLARGGSFSLARQWGDVDRKFERKLKRRHAGPRLCPICNPKTEKTQMAVAQ